MVQITKATARAIAERVTQKPCKLKDVNFRRCIFVDKATSTEFYGLTWNEALDKLVVKYGHPELSGGFSSQIGSDPSKPALGQHVADQGATPSPSTVS